MGTRDACIVLVDPSTGLETFSRACRDAGVGLIVVLTENARRYPDYFERPKLPQVEQLIECDAADLTELVSRLGREYDVREVCAGDEAAVAIAEQANRRVRGLEANDPDTASVRVSKVLMHQALRRDGLPVPEQAVIVPGQISATELEGLTAQWQYPLILKPEVCAGSVCTYRIDAPPGLGPAVDRAVAERATHDLSEVSAQFVLQEFIEGPEYLVNAYSVDGRHFVTGVYHYTKFTNFDVPVYQSVNFAGVGEAQKEIVEYVRTVLDHLGVRRGLTNTDLILSPAGPRLLEINARIVGFAGSLSRLERRLFGRNQADLVARHAAGETLRDDALEGSLGKVVLLQSRFDRPMRAPADDRITRLESYAEHRWWKRAGAPLRDARSYLHDTVGEVLLAHPRRETLERDFEALVELQNTGALF